MKQNLFKVKEGKLDQWKEWCALLNTKYKDEAIETLKEEGLMYEGCDLFLIEGTYYISGVTKGEAKAANMDREINQLHKKNKNECLEFVGEAQNLYQFELK